MQSVIVGIVCFIAGAAATYLVLLLVDRSKAMGAGKRATEIIQQAEREAENLSKQSLLNAREEALKEREKMLGEVEKTRQQLHDQERKLDKREDTVRQRTQSLDKREKTLESSQRKAAEIAEQCEKRRTLLDQLIEQQRDLLQKITGLDRDQAKRMLLDKLESEFSDELGERVQKFEQALKATTEQRTREVLLTALQRFAAQHTAESTVSTIDLPSDDVKGRIIGREGRNIRAFEKAAGVDVIVDDTPGIVVVSGFEPVRREVAKLAMQKLISDGRIHPTRIEEVVNATREEMEKHVLEIGREAAQEADVHNLHERLLTLLGKLKFRTSYSQNVLLHSLEVSHMCGLIAEELGLDATIARRCGLLHDIGKAADHELEGGHPKVGADIAKRCNESEEVIHACLGHHDDLRIERPYTLLVAIGDSISASRPGARRETLEKYIKRLEELEKVACEFPGVESAYAIQAGREVRVIADASKTSDKTAAKVCRDIATAIQERLEYPGEVKVTVLRETRTVEYAR